ncbi:Cro/CI family transcriptional regulator [Hafnia alvei]|uniref:Cro/CI family transcriptional regulator n=1 Tax=Hafnia alvei TaxID=569 RepID=UPI00103351A5|nr:Cro/CI family transcriptional regulator [Hafnia alvei]MCE9870300.1 Cro/CI family transcriptional regulator [Hafnia alvei]TBL95144.1 hypothetical protein EYY90_08720 [Hafnia alvei]
MKKEVVLSYFGGVGKTANALGIKHSSVSGWSELIPEGRAYQLEKITAGALTVNPSFYAKQHIQTCKK